MEKMGYNLANLGFKAAGTAINPGEVALANEGAFAASFQSQPLTDYACGWNTQDKSLETLLDFLAPSVKVARRFDYRKANNGDAFAMAADDTDVRALYGDFQMIKSIGDVVTGKTVSKGLTTVIERDSEMPGEREAKVAWLKRMLLKAECYRAWSLLNTASTNAAKTWGSSATPDKDLMDAIEAFGDAVGIDANRVLFGSGAWAKRFGSYQGQALKNFAPPQTQQALGDFLAADVLVSRDRYTSGSSKAKIASTNTVLVFRGEKTPSVEDPSTLKRFWTPEVGGGEYATYVDETNPKLIKITVAHTSNIVTTCSTGVQKLTIS